MKTHDPQTGIFSIEQSKTNAMDEGLVRGILNLYPAPAAAADLGCGHGLYCQAFHSSGWPIVHGYEGTDDIHTIAVHSPIFVVNLAQQQTPYCDGGYDFVLCLEVAEHIPKKFESQFAKNLETFTKPGGALVISWAPPGQGGVGHVNERAQAEVLELLQRHGFEQEELRTQELRRLAGFPWRGNILAMRRMPPSE